MSSRPQTSAPALWFSSSKSTPLLSSNTQSDFTAFEVRTTWPQLFHGKQMASSIWGVFPTWLSRFTFTLISQQTLSTFTAHFNVKTELLTHSVNNLRSYPNVMAFRTKWNLYLVVFQLKQSSTWYIIKPHGSIFLKTCKKTFQAHACRGGGTNHKFLIPGHYWKM